MLKALGNQQHRITKPNIMFKVDKIMVNWENKIAKIALPTPFAVGDVNVYVVKGDALTLIDTGLKTKETKEALDYKLGELKLKVEDIEQIVLTHHHPDHAGALDFFAQDVPLYGHKNNQRWLDGSDEFLHRCNQFFLEYADLLGIEEELKGKLTYSKEERAFYNGRKLAAFLAEGDEIPGLPNWKTIETLGHAQSHISLYRESDAVLIGGDHVIAKISPNPIIEPPFSPGGERPKPLLQYNESLRKILNFPILKVYSGHGEEVEGVEEWVQFRMNRQHERAMQVKKMLEEKPLTGFEICKRLFPKVYRKETDLTMWETIGQLDYLEDLGEIKSEIQSGLTLFSIA